MHTLMLEHSEGSRQKHPFTHAWPCLIWVWPDVGGPIRPNPMTHGEGLRGVLLTGGLENTALVPGWT